MKHSKIQQVNEILSDIAKGDFKVRDISTLLITLRDYCGDNREFREVSHFIAHSDHRKQGLTQEYLEAISLMMYYHFGAGKGKLSFTERSPKMFRTLLASQNEHIANHKQREGKRDALAERNKFRKELGKYLKTESNPNYVKFVNAPPRFLEKCNSLLSSLYIRPMATATSFKEAFIEVLRKNMFIIEEKIWANWDKVVMAILLMFDDVTFEVDGLPKGTTKIDLREGKVQVWSVIPIADSQSSISFPVFETDLLGEDWIGENTDMSAPLKLNPNFKLCN